MVKYSDGLDELAAALAHPGRRHIIDRLRAGSATTSELAGLLGIGLPAVTKHLGLLTAAGLTRSAKSGRVVTHDLSRERLLEYSAWLATRESFWHHQIDALTTYLEQS
jgi:DNA-binding transcriptional ArsR family regulator